MAKREGSRTGRVRTRHTDRGQVLAADACQSCVRSFFSGVGAILPVDAARVALIVVAMRLAGWLGALCAVVVWGCVSRNGTSGGDLGKSALQHLAATNVTVTVTPRAPILGRVTAVNSGLRFVVIDFSLGGVPALERRLGVYRNGQRVAEVKVSGPQSETLIAADISAGTVQIGDEVKED
jgi:hypothetical protein